MISAVLMAACSQNPGLKPANPANSFQLESGFLAADDHTIEVIVTAEKPAVGIELISPAGLVQPATRIERTRIASGAAGDPEIGFGVGVFGGSNSGVGTAVGIGFPLTIGGEAARRPMVRSRAELSVTDLAAYRSEWRRWRIRVSFDDPLREITTPAPPPPE
ncbi:MAG: hypothetical protein ACREEE_04520 [Dongiaceae bacterium]